MRVAFVLLLLLAACVPAGVDERLPPEGNEPFMIDRGSERGVLLMHGLTATPWEVRPLADYLAQQNYTVIAPLLAGHGTTEKDLNAVRWEEWRQTGRDSLALLRNKTKKVFVAGESTGADVAILLAGENDLDGLILISPPIELQDWRTRFARAYQFMLPYASHSISAAEAGHYYERVPSHAVAELVAMITVVKKVLPHVTEPTLILQSINDKTVKPQSADYVYQTLGSKDKELRLYGNASHVLTQERDAPSVIFGAVDGFLRAH